MSKIFVLNIIILLIFSSFTNGDFDITLKYCRFKCGEDTCTDNSVQTSDASSQIKGYYWRDYFGAVPSDAFPLGKSEQYPQTYIARVLDNANNGTFITTIVEGQDFVYSAYQGKANKLTTFIQIFCTMEPKKLSWVKLTKENVKELLAKNIPVSGTHHYYIQGRFKAPKNHFVVKSEKCEVNYASYTTSISDKVEFALTDGQVEVLENYNFLLYNKEDSGDIEKESEGRSFFTHYHKYEINPGSIIPKFYKRLTIGSCSITCTNEKQPGDKQSTSGDAKKLQNSMEYYWKPKKIYAMSDDGFKAGHNFLNKTLFVGKAYISMNHLDVGSVEKNDVAITFNKMSVMEGLYFSVLCTKQPQNFEWVKTNPEEFSSLDKTRMIRGGELNDGTLTYVGRSVDKESANPVSIRLYQNGTTISLKYGSANTFEVLMTKEKK